MNDRIQSLQPACLCAFGLIAIGSMVCPNQLAGQVSHRGVTQANVIDLDPDRFNPIVGSAGNTYTQDGGISLFEDDLVVPGANSIKGGAASEFRTNFVAESSQDGFRYFSGAFARSGIINTSSNSIALSAFTRASVSDAIEIQTSQGALTFAGNVITTQARDGVAERWGYFERWETSGSITVDSDLGGRYEVQFSDPTSDLTFPTDQQRNKTGIFHVANVTDRATLTIGSQSLAGIGDGFMEPQGDVANPADWPSVWANTLTVVNAIPGNRGDLAETAFDAETSSSWSDDLREFLTRSPGFGFTSRARQLLEQALESTPQLPQPQLEFTIKDSANRSPDDLAMFLYLPTDSYYEVPFQDQRFQTFLTPDDEPILSIDDFAGLNAPIRIFAEGVDLGLFGNGDQLDFESTLGHGVVEFQTVSTSSGQADPWQMRFQFGSPTAFILVSNVPEPTSGLLLMLGVFVRMGVLRRRER